jgi:hypothetical protein
VYLLGRRHDFRDSWIRQPASDAGPRPAVPNQRPHRRWLVWLVLGLTASWLAIGIGFWSSRRSPPEASWSVVAPGTLSVQDRPVVHVSDVGPDVLVRVETDEVALNYQLDTQLRTGASTSPARVFWRGPQLLIDAGPGNVWSIDPDTDEVARVADTLGWSASR